MVKVDESLGDPEFEGQGEKMATDKLLDITIKPAAIANSLSFQETLIEHNNNAIMEVNNNVNGMSVSFNDRFDTMDANVSHLGSTLEQHSQVALLKLENIETRQDEFETLTESALDTIIEEQRYQKFEISDTLRRNRKESKTDHAEIKDEIISIKLHVNDAKQEIANRIDNLGRNMEYQFRSMYAIIKKNFMDISEELASKYISIMRQISDSPGQTVEKLSILLNIKQKTLYRDLAELREKNILKIKKKQFHKQRGRPKLKYFIAI